MATENLVPWPTGSPSELLSWLDARATEQLGQEANKWLGVVEHSSSMIRNIADPDSKWLYREVALKATQMAREAGAFDDSLYRERMMYARLSYVRLADRDLVWRKDEMAEIADFFLDGLPVDIESTREKIRYARSRPDAWRSVEVSDLIAMRETKMLLKLIADLRDLLAGDRLRQVDKWIELLPEMVLTAQGATSPG